GIRDFHVTGVQTCALPIYQLERPRVGLLNVGTEPMKGNELTKEAYQLLEQLPINFVGNIEARDILNDVCDVIVCDGFAGNIMLRSEERRVGTEHIGRASRE